MSDVATVISETVIGDLIGKLGDHDADDTCRALLKLGAPALPHLQEAFSGTPNRLVRFRLAQVIAQSRSVDAVPFLRDLLDHEDPEFWKTALDGLVYVGWHEATARREVLSVLDTARGQADLQRRDWIDEARDKVRENV
jgi:hypothetical protein